MILEINTCGQCTALIELVLKLGFVLTSDLVLGAERLLVTKTIAHGGLFSVNKGGVGSFGYVSNLTFVFGSSSGLHNRQLISER